MRKHFPAEFVFQIFSLIIAVIIIHAIYVAVIRPSAAAIQEEQRYLIAEDPQYEPQRSFYVIVQDFEQEACFVLFFSYSFVGVAKAL